MTQTIEAGKVKQTQSGKWVFSVMLDGIEFNHGLILLKKHIEYDTVTEAFEAMDKFISDFKEDYISKNIKYTP